MIIGFSKEAKHADLLIGAVLMQRAKAPNLVTREMIRSTEPGSVVLDMSMDQGGCAETVYNLK